MPLSELHASTYYKDAFNSRIQPVKKVVSGCFGCMSTPTPGILRQKMVLFMWSFLLAMAATRYEPSFPPQLNRTCR